MINLANRDLNAMVYSEDKSEIFDLVFLWKLIQSKRWFIFTITAITFSLALIYSLNLPTIYTARGKVLIERIDQSAYQNPEILKPQAEWGATYYLTRAELIKSRHILELAAELLNLKDYYGKMYRQNLTNEQAAAILTDKVETKILRGTQIIELSVTDTNPEWAAKIANAISENFLKESWRERLFIAEQLLKWFPQEGETLAQSSPIQKLKKLEKEDAIESLPSISRDPVINSIKQERVNVDAQIRELSRRYTPEHPKMKELISRAEYLESEMKAQMDKIISGLKSGLVGEFGVSNVKVVEEASIPSEPSGPRRFRFTALATLLGFFGSILLLALLRYLDESIKVEEDVRRIPLPFLGYLPKIVELAADSRNSGTKKGLVQILSDNHLCDEISSVRAALLFSMPAEKSKLLMCTSAIPEEGKTTIISMLSIALADAGEKVIIIDADMRKPSLHKLFGLENKCGLTNYLIGSTGLSDVIHAVDGVPRLSIVTAGEHTPNPTILLSSTTIDQLIAELQPDYDKIIFDVPPSLHIPDGLILAGKMHGTILIFDAGKIHQNVGRKIKEKIISANGVVIGGIINRANYKNLDYPYDQYYSKYSKYYHQSGHQEATFIAEGREKSWKN